MIKILFKCCVDWLPKTKFFFTSCYYVSPICSVVCLVLYSIYVFTTLKGSFLQMADMNSIFNSINFCLLEDRLETYKKWQFGNDAPCSASKVITLSIFAHFYCVPTVKLLYSSWNGWPSILAGSNRNHQWNFFKV